MSLLAVKVSQIHRVIAGEAPPLNLRRLITCHFDSLFRQLLPLPSLALLLVTSIFCKFNGTTERSFPSSFTCDYWHIAVGSFRVLVDF